MFRFHLLLSIMVLSLARASELLRGSNEQADNTAISLDEENLGFLDTGMFEDHDEEDEAITADRSLLVQYPLQCQGDIVPFDLKFDLRAQGGHDTSGCSRWRKRRLGNAINSLLLDYGLGPAGSGDPVTFHAEVCTTPTTNRRRRLASCNCSFLYKGVMNCGYYCRDDNKDRRALEGDEENFLDGERRLATGDPNWFVNIYAPSMENALRNAFVNNIQRSHTQCLGNGPMVDVQITKRNSIKTSVC